MDCLSTVVDGLPERTGGIRRASNRDVVNSAFSAFFFQFPSLLRYMRKMEEQEKRSNVQSLFDVSGILSDNQIRNIVDEIEPSVLNPVFNETLKTERARVIDDYRVLDGGVFLALDGLWYVSSETIHCDHCLTKTVKDKAVNRASVNCRPRTFGSMVRPQSHSFRQ